MTKTADKAVVETLSTEIRRHLQKGIDLDVDTEILFTELTGHPIAMLDSLFNDADDEEIESVISLLMTPDSGLQAALEILLGQYPVTPALEKEVTKQLIDTLDEIEIRPSDGQTAVIWCPPGWALDELISRLHLTWAIDSSLSLVTDRFLTDQEKLRFWIALRNSQIDLTPLINECFTTLVENKKRFGNAFFEHLDLLLTVWGGPTTHVDPLKAMARLKGSYVKALRQNHRFEKASRSHNMETLMLQGVVTPTIDVETALHQISMIDNLTLTLYGTIVSVDDTSEMMSFTEKHLKQIIQ